jgi:galactose mutarotase-like enzyme
MESFEQKKNKEFRIESIKTPEGNEVSFSQDRGGIITSLKLEGEEILYLDNETFKNPEVSVKGGIPILFPNAGPIPDEIKTEELKNLKQHGFARDSKFVAEKIPNGFRETLVSDEETKKVYPYNFNFELEGIFEADGSFTLTQTVENLEKEKEMPISSGFHPYFKVSSEEKKNIKFNFEGGKSVEEQIEIWANGKAISVANPNAPIEVYIPNLGTLVITTSKEYKRIWGWSQTGKDFVCVEPVMNDKGGIITNPEKIKPNEKHISKINILLKKEN